ncbi:MAG TPA: nucleoside hydrolase-like domain-containing protein [Pricia sp.]|nr:nucleoside hydrolase-like domain-containing protein [Pricia sp.]
MIRLSEGKNKVLPWLLILAVWSTTFVTAQSTYEKPRTIVTTDGEIDDVDSFIRMLLYANEFDIEGLVYSSSMWHYKGDGKGTKFVSEMEMTKRMYGERTDLRWPGTQWMQGLIDAYEEVHPNLTLHAEGFPTPSYLRSLVKVGNIDFEGAMEKDTEGSNFIKSKLLDEHIINGHGPLTKRYYSYGDGQKQEGDDEHIHGDPTKLQNAQWGSFGKNDFISEGDSPAFLHLIDVGLDNLEHPDYGGWGGRLKPSESNPGRWEDGEEVAEYNPYTQKRDKAYPQTRWIKTLQLDFAARADWCVKAFDEANHAPKVTLNHPDQVKVDPGDVVQLSGEATDPDGDALTYLWWPYQEVGTYKGDLVIKELNTAEASLKIPEDIKEGETIHIILEVADAQFPTMTRYERLVLTAR